VSEPHRVVLLPGSVLPAGPAYGALIEALGSSAEVVAKDLEVYATAVPPDDYGLDHEVAGVLREADARGWDRFHLGGYSGGGSSALAFAALHPERLWSLALLEPAWAGNGGWSPAEQAVWSEYQRLRTLPPAEYMRAFMELGVKPGVVLPPPPEGKPPPWMAKRPAGIRAFLRTFDTYELDVGALRSFTRPVYYALGGLSNPDQYEENATRLESMFPDFELEVFEDRHHFDPPHRIEPERLARSLIGFWQRAESISGSRTSP
jgi:pimeloyl-ACP methyl ester carboxylesterase